MECKQGAAYFLFFAVRVLPGGFLYPDDERGGDVPREKLTDEQIQKIVADFVEMKNYSAVARKNNVSDNTVRKYVAESSDI